MKKILSIYIGVLFSGLFLMSCGDEKTDLVDSIEGSPNFIGFYESTDNFSGIADGSEYTFQIPVLADGPSVGSLSGSYSGTISVDPTSTAVEGTHFRLDSKTVTVDQSNDYLNTIEVVMLTQGIVTPLAAAPVLKLKITDVSGSGNIVASGKTLDITMNYLCPSDLAGLYVATITSSSGSTVVFNDFVTQTGDGQYRGQTVGTWAPGSIGGTPGFDFIDVCNVISVPTQNLVDLYSNEVFQAGSSYVDPGTGDLHIEYTITFSAGNRNYVADYVKL